MRPEAARSPLLGQQIRIFVAALKDLGQPTGLAAAICRAMSADA
jgi:hypothetical protein